MLSRVNQSGLLEKLKMENDLTFFRVLNLLSRISHGNGLKRSFQAEKCEIVEIPVEKFKSGQFFFSS
jgi:hypothetical protein